ncbi:MAG: 2-oxoacid:acceptor oxidoreductase family protein [Chloroflexota bacterium]
MQTEIILAGFGGQGILFGGMILAYAAMDNGQNTTWIPSYGPEMRGGTANVTVIISDEEIGSPIVRQPQAVIAFNIPSLEKYEPLVKTGGVLVYNSSLIDRAPQRTDITYVPVPANDIAKELGNVKMANMVAVGALITATKLLPLSAISQALQNHLPASKRASLPENERALSRGVEVVKSLDVMG